MDRVTKVDRLFALKALESRIKDEREQLEHECREELVARYGAEGIDRMQSPYFGPEAGKYSVKRYKAVPDSTKLDFYMGDDVAFAEWCEENLDAVVAYAKAHAADFAQWWMSRSGELPGGMDYEDVVVPGKPESISAQVYSFNPDIVLEKLAYGGNVLEGANRLLLGDGE